VVLVVLKESGLLVLFRTFCLISDVPLPCTRYELLYHRVSVAGTSLAIATMPCEGKVFIDLAGQSCVAAFAVCSYSIRTGSIRTPSLIPNVGRCHC
jgi:hypothetical protein